MTTSDVRTSISFSFEGGEMELQKIEAHWKVLVARLKGEANLSGRINRGSYVSVECESIIECVKMVGCLAEVAQIHHVYDIRVDYIYRYNCQCNMEFSLDEIRALSNVGAALNVTCYSDGD